MLNLIPLAESVVKLKAVCMVCFNDAAFTKRLGAEKEVATHTHTHTLNTIIINYLRHTCMYKLGDHLFLFIVD